MPRWHTVTERATRCWFRSPDGYKTWWSYVPHFIGTPGYVYAYAYGQLLALSVYGKYLVRSTKLHAHDASDSVGEGDLNILSNIGATMIVKTDIAPRPMKSLALTSVTRTRPASCAALASAHISARSTPLTELGRIGVPSVIGASTGP